MNEGDDQLTVVTEGDFYELFGWLLPISPRPSVSGTYPNRFFSQYEIWCQHQYPWRQKGFCGYGSVKEVPPMDIYPQQLFKISFHKMLNKWKVLGINELSEEDVALCEFVCT